MPKNKFLIAPFNSGLQQNEKPWLIPEDAFETLKNAQIYRGRIAKRIGSRFTYPGVGTTQWENRLSYKLANKTSPLGAYNSTVAGHGLPGNKFHIGQAFHIGDKTLTVIKEGDADKALLSSDSLFMSGTLNTVTKRLIINTAPANSYIHFYTAEPVMGFLNIESGTTLEKVTYAFDTQFSYYYLDGKWSQIGTSAEIPPEPHYTWSGTNSNFFSGDVYPNLTIGADIKNTMFVTNFNSADGVKFKTDLGTVIKTYQPIYDTGTKKKILTTKIILYHQNRLLFFCPIEETATGTKKYSNRVRFSQKNVDPLKESGGYYTVFTGTGSGKADGSIQEEIIGVKVFNGHIVVYFEGSIWELVYTHNKNDPYIWKQLNKELGATSQFGAVNLDVGQINISRDGIFVNSGNNVKHIDSKIPDEIFNLDDSLNSLKRINGIRDFKSGTIYWTVPGDCATPEAPYNRSILNLNYETGSWAILDDSVTCFSELIEESKSANSTSLKKSLIAGNQQGFIFVLDEDEDRNASALSIAQISNVGLVATLTVYAHNLLPGDYIYLENCVDKNGNAYSLNGKIFKVATTISEDIFTINLDTGETLPEIYGGQGTIAKVTTPELRSKDYSFFISQGVKNFIPEIKLMVNKTYFATDPKNVECTLDFYASSASSVIIESKILQTKAFSTLESLQERLWSTIYTSMEGETVQFKLSFKDALLRADSQIRNPEIAHGDFEIHAMLFSAVPTSAI